MAHELPAYIFTCYYSWYSGESSKTALMLRSARDDQVSDTTTAWHCTGAGKQKINITPYQSRLIFRDSIDFPEITFTT